MLKTLLPIPTLLACLCLFANTDAHARQAHSRSAPHEFVIKVAQNGVSMREAINRVRKQTGGRVLDAQERDGFYQIKVLTPSGEVRVLRVDAQTGAIR